MNLKELYLAVTRDPDPPHTQAIARAFGRQPPRRRRLVKLYLRDLSDRQVANKTGQSHGSARDMLRRIMFGIMKAHHRWPRYHQLGRARPAPPPSLAPDGLPHQAPPGGPVTARAALKRARKPA